MTKGKDHHYDADGTTCIGYLALPDGHGPFPGVLVSPAFAGLSDKERATCDRLAAQGYVALGVDYYANGTLAKDREEAAALMATLQSDRPLLASRLVAALTELRGLPQTQGQKLGAMGYCFGGKSILDLARVGADFAAGVILHGVYDAPSFPIQKMKANLLVCDGWDDGLCPPDAKVALAQELTDYCDDWQMLAFGGTGHAFTNPDATPSKGSGYSAKADARSWKALTDFFHAELHG
ncbi:dienelactone hydrolase family protein [Pseudooceanicola sp. MF1-13]|uniref:dienelactone hydrolase family protein n=1 Tax=Pseudooceanicola sp. MF1-13 TaxID=3379095 RepID=UPI0038920F08